MVYLFNYSLYVKVPLFSGAEWHLKWRTLVVVFSHTYSALFQIMFLKYGQVTEILMLSKLQCGITHEIPT